jgi:hypothetical protein
MSGQNIAFELLIDDIGGGEVHKSRERLLVVDRRGERLPKY